MKFTDDGNGTLARMALQNLITHPTNLMWLNHFVIGQVKRQMIQSITPLKDKASRERDGAATMGVNYITARYCANRQYVFD